MTFSLRHAVIFLGCVIGCAVLAGVLVATYAGLFGPFDVVADRVSKLSVLAAFIPASWITKRLNILYARRTARRLLEKEWEKWGSQLLAEKSASLPRSAPIAKKVA